MFIKCVNGKSQFASLPTLMQPGADVPLAGIILLLLLVVINGGFWIYFSASRAHAKDIIPSLRNE